MTTWRPLFAIGGRKIAVDAPHLAFVTAIAGWCVWFCRDAWLSQTDIENLIMIAPATFIVVILYAFVAAGCFKVVDGGTEHAPPQRPPLDGSFCAKVAATMALLAGFVVAGPLIGFDVASFVYILAMLLLLGERRILVLLLAPTLFCALAIYCFDQILLNPLPLYFFSGASS